MQSAKAEPRDQEKDLKEVKRRFRAYESNKQDEIDESREARRYYHGKQWSDYELKRLRKRRQPAITSNHICRKVDFIVGVEQRLRRDPKAYPRNPQDEQSAFVATSALRYVCDDQRWHAKSATANHDGIVSGFGVLFIGVEQGQQGGEVVIKEIDCSRFFYDPRSRRCDFSDAKYMGIHIWMDLEEAISTWPDQEDKLRDIVDSTTSDDALYSVEDDEQQQWADLEHKRVRIVEFWEKRSGKWEYCKICGATYLEHGPSPYVDEHGQTACPYVAWSPYMDEVGQRYGMIRNLKSMQDEINHRRSKFLHMLGVHKTFYQDGDIEDEDKFRREMSRPDGMVKHQGTWGQSVGVIDQSQEMAGQAQLLQEAKQELEMFGPNSANHGKGEATNAPSGRAYLAQRDSGMTELTPLFENYRDFKLRCYRRIWFCTKQAWTVQKWIRVTDDQNVVQFMSVNQVSMDQMGQVQTQNMIGQIDVDIMLDEGPDTITMAEEEFEQLSMMVQAGLPIPPEAIIKASSLRNKHEILEALQQAQQPPQPDPLAQEAMMAELRQKHAKTAELQTQAKLNEARAIQALNDNGDETMPEPEPFDPFALQKAEADLAEQMAKVEELRSRAQLNMARAGKEAIETELKPIEAAIAETTVNVT